jgi:AraC-like DNA-binding protein
MGLNKSFTHSLPVLVFGNRSASLDSSVGDMCESLKSVLPGMQECASLIDHKAFRHSSALLTINGMSVLASASTPTRIKVGATQGVTLMIPFSGHGDLTVDERTLHWQAGSKAVLLPNCGYIDEGSARSVLMINIDPQRLEMITRSMLGLASDAPLSIELQTPRELSIQLGRVFLETVFRQLANLLDELSLQPELINRSGLDEVFYRNIAMMLQPTLFLDASTSSPNRKYARRLLDRSCQYVQAHLSEAISLADLERVGCMSRRKLHYAFLKRYNYTPMQWIRAERLVQANSQLTKAIPGDTVTNIALSCGFSKPSTFASYYFKHFGELPSATLSRALAR